VRTAGGRVLAVVGIADDLGEARDEAYAIASSIHFEGAGYRSDIAADALGMVVAS
jgi:phosphoribosylamine--glycine ligase